MKVHIYRNRSDDHRRRAELHFCGSCVGWYGVPHTDSHCQQRMTAKFSAKDCACRFCCEATGRPVQGRHGRFSESPQWQPLASSDPTSADLAAATRGRAVRTES